MKKTLGTTLAIMVVAILTGTFIKVNYAIAGEIARDGRFIAYDDGTVLDTKTKLMWAAEDNGADINWANAEAYCENYRGGGYTEWRMPTLDELEGLYDDAKTYKSNCGFDVHLTELIRLTCITPWASGTSDSAAARFRYYDGTRYWYPQWSDDFIRALPVRRSGKEGLIFITPTILPPMTESMVEEKAEEKVVILASETKVEEKIMAAASEPKVIIFAFEDVHFDFDQATLKPEAQAILKRNIRVLKENPKTQIRIAGYTSASGTEAYNQKLSERRANAVKEYLVKEGVIASDRLSIIGYGETRPAMYEAAPENLYSEAAKANMRVLFEIIVEKKS